MSGRFTNRNHAAGSGDHAFESACACASFFAALLLLVDTVIAVSIFVSADAGILSGAAVSVFLLRRLLGSPEPTRSKPVAA